MRAGGTMLEVDGMVPIQVRAVGDAISISRPEGASKVVGRQAEAVTVLAETIDVWVLGETGFDADVLWLEDQRVAFGGEEDFVRLGSEDREGERLSSVLELDLRCLGRLRRWTGNNGLGDFVTVHGWIGDLDVNPSV